MKKLYLFDFDGTLTTKDTMFLFLQYFHPQKYKRNFLLFIPVFVLLKLKLLKAEMVKQKFISSILKGEKKEKIEEKSQQFFKEYFPVIFRKNALDFIENIDRESSDCYIVSASLDLWVRPFAEHLGFKFLVTEAEFKDDVFTGKFKTKNCNGQEKVNRILREINEKDYSKKIAFGDTSGDLPMLEWADEANFRFFN